MNTASATVGRSAVAALEPDASRLRRGFLLGLLGVALFALTIPMTRLASGPFAAPQLSPWFVALGRAEFAGVVAVADLVAVRAPGPRPRQWRRLALPALGGWGGLPRVGGV